MSAAATAGRPIASRASRDASSRGMSIGAPIRSSRAPISFTRAVRCSRWRARNAPRSGVRGIDEVAEHVDVAAVARRR